jgi:dihydrofolate reductase
MGRIVVTEFVTLDGVFEDPGGQYHPQGGWAFKFDRGDAGNKFKFDELMAAEAQLLGRKTYEGFAAAWPSMGGDEFGDKMNSMPKFVVSSTLTEPVWNATTISYADVPSVKERVDGDLLVAGSGELVQALVHDRRVDELRLMVYPVLLGSGRKLFGDDDSTRDFEIVDAETSADVVLLTLRQK